jgi:APA family basic amino acid/polyamine antiporter
VTVPSIKDAGLVRGLGLAAAASAAVGNMIGTGVFLKARVMTCNVEEPLLVLGAWVVAALLSLGGALAYAELAAMFPRAGGDYNYLREAYGSRVAFLFGWEEVVIGRAASPAAKATICAIFLNVLSGGALDGPALSFSIFGYPVTLTMVQVVAVAAIWAATLVSCAAVQVGGGFSVALTALKMAVLVGVAAGAFFLARGDWSNFLMSDVGGTCEGVAASVQGGAVGFGAALLGALWAYDGWTNATTMAGEVRDPQRTMPRALIGGVLITAIIYTVVNAAYFYALTPTEVASVPESSSVASEVVGRFLGPAAVTVIAVAILLSTVGSLQTSIMGAGRIPYAMARDGIFFPALGKLSPRTRVPVRALVALAIWSSVLACSGTFDTLTDMVVFASFVFYVMNTVGLFLLRRRRPDLARPYRTWGYPWLPALFIITALWLMAVTVQGQPVRSLIGLGLIAAGLPIHEYYARRSARASAAADSKAS